MGFNTVHACDIHVTWPTWIRHACQHYCTMHVTSTLMLHACDIHITITVTCMSYKHSWCRHVAWVWQSCMHVKCVWHACYMHNISSRVNCHLTSLRRRWRWVNSKDSIWMHLGYNWLNYYPKRLYQSVLLLWAVSNGLPICFLCHLQYIPLIFLRW